MPDTHAILSPSKAEQWMPCPGSIVLSDGMSNPPSPYAAEGTKAHSCAEYFLTEGKWPAECYDEMRGHLRVYVDFVNGLAVPSTTFAIEQKVVVDDGCWGTADAIVWDPVNAVLHVCDLKYGAGVAVEVNGNKQLKVYALAALLTMRYPAKTVNMHIIQPRCPHADGSIRTATFDAIDLIDFHADLADAFLRVKEARRDADQGIDKAGQWADTYLHPTEKGCKWCLGSPKCPKLREKAHELCKQTFNDSVVPGAYDPEALASALEFLPILEAWIENTRAFAYREAEAGRSVPRHKLVEKRATASWKPDLKPEALALLLEVPVADLLAAPKLKSVTDIRALAPGKNDKERGAVLDPFVQKISSGHTLVHMSDKRPAVALAAKDVFA